MNPSWLKLMLDPLYINQESGMWPETYAEHDLGIYPNATGHQYTSDEAQPLEECGNMLIMTLVSAGTDRGKHCRTNADTYACPARRRMLRRLAIPHISIRITVFWTSGHNISSLTLLSQPHS